MVYLYLNESHFLGGNGNNCIFFGHLNVDSFQIRRKSAKALKDEGNVLYLAGENSSAIAKYSEGLELCPLCFKEDRAILFANRAAVHIKTVESI